jgi:hypothetical protein
MDQAMQTLDRLLEPVGRALNGRAAHELLSLRADAQTQARIDDLADRCREGQLSNTERGEYESLVAASGMIAILQAKARVALATPPAA